MLLLSREKKMIIEKHNISSSEEIHNSAQFQFQLPDFEVKIDSQTQISKRGQSSKTTVDAPITRELAATASALINRLAMSYPELTVQTQANANRDKVKLLLEDHI